MFDLGLGLLRFLAQEISIKDISATLDVALTMQCCLTLLCLTLPSLSEKARNDDLLFPNVLPSMLTLLKAEKDSQLLSRAQYCVVVSTRPLLFAGIVR